MHSKIADASLNTNTTLTAANCILEIKKRQTFVEKLKKNNTENYTYWIVQIIIVTKEHVMLTDIGLCHRQAAVTEEDKEQMIVGLQKKVAFLEGWLYKNHSEDENVQELLKEVSE